MKTWLALRALGVAIGGGLLVAGLCLGILLSVIA